MGCIHEGDGEREIVCIQFCVHFDILLEVCLPWTRLADANQLTASSQVSASQHLGSAGLCVGG